MKVGSKYPDYVLEDLNGLRVSIGKIIKGKWALIDLWASWCGSCRSFSRILIPLYHKYKDRGFIIVGIAREKSVNDVLCALALEKYPWMQFVELEDKNSIWLKHGIENAGVVFFGR